MDKNNGNQVASGLDGVVVAETRLSDVDGERGRLIIGGYDVEQLTRALEGDELIARLDQHTRLKLAATLDLSDDQRVSNALDNLHNADVTLASFSENEAQAKRSFP